ncbi:MAG: PilZ domain-containing protein [Candidatus Acidiferrales bacterium]
MAWEKLLNRVASAPVKEIGPEHPDSVASLADLNPPEAKRETRRSKRVYISMSVLVKYQRAGQQCEEQTVTDSVNAQGCLLRLNVALERGQKITIINLKSEQEMECRVAYVGQSEGGKTQAGVEFMRPSDYFWHIAFPPDDWNPADRKRPVMERAVAEKSSKRA